MNAPLPVALEAKIPSLQMNEAELIKVLESSLYPGADAASIKLVIGVCRAAQLDPLQKPYHLVPMDVKVKLPSGQKENGKDHKYEKRDVVMPGIGLYRIQAERSGEYAGCSEPVFGPPKVLKIKYQEDENGPEKERDFEYPEWCRMTVRRMVNGQIVEFTHTEYWIENYATKSRYSKEPNAMWTKRPRGQIAKCTEAQCLRKAFPSIGAQPTAEEMEGKTIEVEAIVDGVVTGKTVEQPQPRIESPAAGEGTAGNAPSAGGGGEDRKEPENKGPFKPMLDAQKRMLRARLASSKLSALDLEAKFGKKLDAADETGFAFSDYNGVEQWIRENAKA